MFKKMKRYITYIVCLLLVFPAISWSGWQDMEGNHLPDRPDRKAIGDFGAHLIFTDKEEETFRRWNIPSRVVDLDTTDKIKRNELLTVLVIFSGCKADENGNCKVIANYKVLQPDGAVYADLPPMEVWFDKPVPKNKSLEMSAQYLRIRIEPHEPLGKYTVHADVTDMISKCTLKLTSHFTAIEGEKHNKSMH